MEPLQQATVVFVVLVLLGATLYWLRAKGMVRYGLSARVRPEQKQLQPLERLPLTAQHSLHLVRVAGRLVLIAVSPSGCSILDHGDRESAGERLASR